MTRLSRSVLVAILLIALDMPARAQTSGTEFSVNSTQDLLNACQTTRHPRTLTNQEAVRFAVCTSTIDGIVAGALATTPTPGFCLPRGTTTGQRVAVFMQWAEANPTEWHQPAVVGVLLATEESFPCSQ